jgi:hypothetical protein
VTGYTLVTGQQQHHQQLSAVIKLYNSRLLGIQIQQQQKQQQEEEQLFVPCSNEVYDLAQLLITLCGASLLLGHCFCSKVATVVANLFAEQACSFC